MSSSITILHLCPWWVFFFFFKLSRFFLMSCVGPNQEAYMLYSVDGFPILGKTHQRTRSLGRNRREEREQRRGERGTESERREILCIWLEISVCCFVIVVSRYLLNLEHFFLCVCELLHAKAWMNKLKLVSLEKMVGCLCCAHFCFGPIRGGCYVGSWLNYVVSVVSSWYLCRVKALKPQSSCSLAGYFKSCTS